MSPRGSFAAVGVDRVIPAVGCAGGTTQLVSRRELYALGYWPVRATFPRRLPIHAQAGLPAISRSSSASWAAGQGLAGLFVCPWASSPGASAFLMSKGALLVGCRRRTPRLPGSPNERCPASTNSHEGNGLAQTRHGALLRERTPAGDLGRVSTPRARRPPCGGCYLSPPVDATPTEIGQLAVLAAGSESAKKPRCCQWREHLVPPPP